MRQSALIKAHKHNERLEFLRARDNVQTSLKSKKQEDQSETAKWNYRKALMHETRNENVSMREALGQERQMMRTVNLQSEQSWLDQLTQMQSQENEALLKRKKDNITDLRTVYREQQKQRKEQQDLYLKF